MTINHFGNYSGQESIPIRHYGDGTVEASFDHIQRLTREEFQEAQINLGILKMVSDELDDVDHCFVWSKPDREVYLLARQGDTPDPNFVTAEVRRGSIAICGFGLHDISHRVNLCEDGIGQKVADAIRRYLSSRSQ